MIGLGKVGRLAGHSWDVTRVVRIVGGVERGRWEIVVSCVSLGMYLFLWLAYLLVPVVVFLFLGEVLK